MVNMTDSMQRLRLDLQRRIDDAMEESKGYRAEDTPVPTMPTSKPNSQTSGSGFEKSSLTNIFNAIDKESMREDKRLNKIAAAAKKQMNSPNIDAKSVSSMGSGLSRLGSEQ